MNRENGFSLLELLIVVGILLIISTIAIPSLLRSRQGTNESAAVANVRIIGTAEATYTLSSGGSYGSLNDLITAGLLDSRFSDPVSGYIFAVTVSNADYTATATPASTNSGRYGYYSATDGVVRYATETSSTCIPCFPANLSGLPVR